MAQALTIPSTLEMISASGGEQLNLTINFTNLIAAGDVCSNPVVTIKTPYNESVPTAIIGSPSISGSAIMNITLSSVPLRAKTSYVLVASCTATGGSNSKNVSAQLGVKIIY